MRLLPVSWPKFTRGAAEASPPGRIATKYGAAPPVQESRMGWQVNNAAGEETVVAAETAATKAAAKANLVPNILL